MSTNLPDYMTKQENQQDSCYFPSTSSNYQTLLKSAGIKQKCQNMYQIPCAVDSVNSSATQLCKWCKRSAKCVTCNLPSHENSECTRTLSTNCRGPHPASSRICPRYFQSKEILEIKTKTKSSLAEAGRIYKKTLPFPNYPYLRSAL